jgi:hypothetical protein
MATAKMHIIYGHDRFGRLASVTSARLSGLSAGHLWPRPGLSRRCVPEISHEA